jgi:hypothetical protein
MTARTKRGLLWTFSLDVEDALRKKGAVTDILEAGWRYLHHDSRSPKNPSLKQKTNPTLLL